MYKIITQSYRCVKTVKDKLAPEDEKTDTAIKIIMYCRDASTVHVTSRSGLVLWE